MNDDTLDLDEIERALSSFFDGELSSTQLQSLLSDSLAPVGTASPSDPAVQLWHGALTNLVFYHFCDFDRSLLEESLRKLVATVRSTGHGTLTPITTSRCFIDALKTRTIPAPLDPRKFTHIGLGEFDR